MLCFSLYQNTVCFPFCSVFLKPLFRCVSRLARAPQIIHGQGLEPSTFLCASVLGPDARSGSQCLKAFPDSPSNRSFLSKFLQFSWVKHATRAFSAKDAEPKNYFPPKFWGSTYSFHFDHRQPWVFTKSCTSSRPCFSIILPFLGGSVFVIWKRPSSADLCFTLSWARVFCCAHSFRRACGSPAFGSVSRFGVKCPHFSKSWVSNTSKYKHGSTGTFFL